MVVGFFVVFSSDVPKLDDPAQDWATFYSDHQDRIQVGVTIVGIGLFFYIWFLGSLRDAIAASEGGTGRLASVAFAGGLIGAVLFMIVITATAAAAFHPDEVDPAITRALNDFGALVAAPAAAGFAALFAASSLAGYRHGAFPAPVAGIAALAAICQPLAYTAALTDSGAFAADGAITFWIPFVTFVAGVLALSISAVRQAGGARVGAQ